MSPQLTIRTARPSDHPAMLELTRDIWDGTDYIPFVWDAWLRDSRGWLMAAEMDGRLVGLQHIERQPDDTAWIEGIRVASEVRDRGIGRRLLERALEWSRENGCSWLRLATSSGNQASKRLAERAGLDLLGEFVSVQADPISTSRDQVSVASTADFELVSNLLARRTTGASSPVYTEGWTAYTLTDQRLRLLLAAGSVVYTANAVAIVTASIVRPSLRLGLLSGGEEGMVAIARWVRGRALDSGMAIVRANVEANGYVVPALRSAGFESRHGNSMLLHGVRLR